MTGVRTSRHQAVDLESILGGTKSQLVIHVILQIKKYTDGLEPVEFGLSARHISKQRHNIAFQHNGTDKLFL